MRGSHWELCFLHWEERGWVKRLGRHAHPHYEATAIGQRIGVRQQLGPRLYRTLSPPGEPRMKVANGEKRRIEAV